MSRKQLISLAMGLFALLTPLTRAEAHAFVVRAEPRVGSKVKKAPTGVRIWFSESVQSGLSSIKVFDATGKEVDKKDTHSDRRSRALLEISLPPDLAPGTYKVVWRVTSVDTHATSGDFRFKIDG
jgi:methionine-rich copper-binding protein CopC